jgi:hypothetical protein
MTIDRLIDAAARRLGYTPSWRSLVRVGLWFLVGLVAINAVVPDQRRDLTTDRYNAAAPDAWVRSITAERGDPRGFTPTTNDGVFKIAWIGGSEIQSINKGSYTFLPMAVRRHLTTVDGRPVSIDMYFVSGMRLVDEYAAVGAAIADGVDLVVVSLNPVWVLNDLAVQGWDNFNGTLVRTNVTRPAAWPLVASLVGPGDALWSLAADELGFVDDRYQWGQRLQARVDELSVLRDPAPAAPGAGTARPSELDRIREMTIPVEFWSTYAPTVDPSAPLAERQAALFERSASSRSTFNDDVLDRIGDAVTKSGIPTLVYTAAVSDAVLDDPRIATQLETIERRLADHASAFDSTRVRYEPQTIARRAPGMKFNDVVHVADLGPLANVMTSDVCKLLTATGHRPECEAP